MTDRRTPPSGNLVLIGMRACGKSTIGRALAERVGRPFVDLDDWLAEAAGRDCDTVLAEEGEASFRQREQDILLRAAQLRDHVVATGGGAVLCGEAFEALAGPATVLYLSLHPEELVRRATHRPATPLTSLSLADEVTTLLSAREPLYRAAADATIRVGVEDPILAALEVWPQRPPEEPRPPLDVR